MSQERNLPLWDCQAGIYTSILLVRLGLSHYKEILSYRQNHFLRVIVKVITVPMLSAIKHCFMVASCSAHHNMDRWKKYCPRSSFCHCFLNKLIFAPCCDLALLSQAISLTSFARIVVSMGSLSRKEGDPISFHSSSWVYGTVLHYNNTSYREWMPTPEVCRYKCPNAPAWQHFNRCQSANMTQSCRRYIYE